MYVIISRYSANSPSDNFIQVRDAAYLHLLALRTPAAGGERINATANSGRFAWQDLYDILNKYEFKGVPVGNPGSGYLTKKESEKKGQTMSNAKARRLFPGFKFHELEESVAAMGRDFKANKILS